jgi:hypothetical protein
MPRHRKHSNAKPRSALDLRPPITAPLSVIEDAQICVIAHILIDARPDNKPSASNVRDE